MNLDIKKLIKEELSGENAKAYVEQISRFHRVQASPMFHEAAEHVKQQLIKNGLQDAHIEQFKSDGATKYWTHTSPIGWEVRTAELRLIEPEQQILVNFTETPTGLHTHSNATPPEGVTAELIDVEKGTRPSDYEGKDVKGKFVLATGRAKLVHEQSVFKYGAAGVITDTPFEFQNVREGIDIPDAHSYQGIWPTADVLDKAKFGFSLSKRQGNHLRELLREHKTVKLHAKVDARLFPSHLEVVTATIQGTQKPDEEIFLIAHLCHPKPTANDNASGSGLLLEIARTIKALIDSNRLPASKRTIRFMWVPETFGSIAYLHEHQDYQNRLIAGINLDMVGQNQELCKSTLTIDRTPDSLPSYLNDLLLALVEDSIKQFDFETWFGSASTFRYAVNVHTGGSDHHEFVDSTIGIPCVMLLQWPDIFYHTSMDTIDKVSTDSLKRIGWIATVAALTLANADTESAILLANQTCSRGIARIEEAQRKTIQQLYETKSTAKSKTDEEEQAKTLSKILLFHKDMVEHIVWREKQAVASTKRLADRPELSNFIQKFTQDIDATGKQALSRIDETMSYISKSVGTTFPVRIEESESEQQAKLMTPKRLFRGTLSPDTFKKVLGEEQYVWYEEIIEKDSKFNQKRAEIINFIDGKRTVYDIVKAVSAEYGQTDMDHVLKFTKDLERTGFITHRQN